MTDQGTRQPTRGVIGLIGAILGTVLMAFSFVNGISAALDGNSDGAGGFVALFLFGLVLVAAALVLAIVRLVQKRSVVIAVLTILVCAVPLGTIIYLRATAQG
jgi:hypothetical protein